MKKEELTEAIAAGIDEGIGRVLWSLTKSILYAMLILVGLALFYILLHHIRYGNYTPSPASSNSRNVDGWGNEYSCFFDNENTPCGKTQYCATHQTYENCIKLNGTWELETEARFWKSVYYPGYGIRVTYPNTIKSVAIK
jgi:hypothetical protein